MTLDPGTVIAILGMIFTIIVNIIIGVYKFSKVESKITQLEVLYKTQIKNIEDDLEEVGIKSQKELDKLYMKVHTIDKETEGITTDYNNIKKDQEFLKDNFENFKNEVKMEFSSVKEDLKEANRIHQYNNRLLQDIGNRIK